jgi:hypothetical protein
MKDLSLPERMMYFLHLGLSPTDLKQGMVIFRPTRKKML